MSFLHSGQDEHSLLGSQRRQVHVAAWTIALVTFALYLPTVLFGDFVDIDDGQYVLENPLIRRPSWDGLSRFVTEVRHPSTVAGYYQPLTMASLMLDSLLGGGVDSALMFHLTNVLLHALNAMLVFLILRCACGGVLAPALGAMLFAVHPVQVESVSWISQRKTVLSAAAALGCVLAHLHAGRTNRRWLRAAVIGAYVLALLAKPTALPLPIFLLLLDVWPLRRPLGRAAIEKWPLAIILIVFAWITFSSQAAGADLAVPNIGAGVGLMTRLDRLGRLALLAGYDLVIYCRNVIWPAQLNFIYPMPEPLAWGHVRFVAAGCAGLAMLAVCLISWRWSKPVFVAGGGMLVLLGAALGPVRFYQSCVGDRFLYLPLASLCLGVTAALAAAWRAPDAPASPGAPRASQLGWGAAVLAGIVLLAQQAIAHQQTWADSESLWRTVLTTNPENPLAHSGMATVLLAHAQERTDAADQARSSGDAARAAALSDEAHALLLDALSHADRAIAATPTNGQYVGLRGDALLRLGQPRAAVAAFEKALTMKLGPLETWGRVSLGRALVAAREMDRAAREFDAALSGCERDKQTGILMEAGQAFSAAGRAELALPYYSKAAEQSPNDPRVQAAVGGAAAATGDWAVAATAYQRAHELQLLAEQDTPELAVALGKALLEMKQANEAERLFALPSVRATDPVAAALGAAGAASIRGDVSSSLQILKRLLADHPEVWATVERKSWFENVRADPRWPSLMPGAQPASKSASQPAALPASRPATMPDG